MESWEEKNEIEESWRIESMASGYKFKGDYRKALEYHEKSLKIRLKLLGEEHEHTAVSYNNIGNLYAMMSE
jgi:hypothetical protein